MRVEIQIKLKELKLEESLLKSRIKFHNDRDYSIEKLNEMLKDIRNQIEQLKKDFHLI